MPVLKYDYSASSFDADTHIRTLNREIADYCQQNPITVPENRERLMSRLLRRSGTAAYNGASRREGGPFGALIVDFNAADGIPKVVGYGTNHVVPTNDPSAHAEMTAIRDASRRLGNSDLSGLTLVTSCECCPMCLSAATGCKIGAIFFAATREEAARVGFSDEDQYRLMKQGGIELHATKAATNTALGQHDAMVEITHNGATHRYYGDSATASPNDPTDLPVIQAIKKACSGLAELRARESGAQERVFHLPADTLLVSRRKPHPMSLITADWARIGRIRGQDPENPSQDSPKKDTSRILYLSDELETMPLHQQGKPTETVAPERIWEEIKNPSAVQLDQNLGRTRALAFSKWEELVSGKAMPRY